MESVTTDYLGKRLQSQDTDGLLILDTRPFMSFNEMHVQGSVDVHLPPIVKRRSGGFVALETLIKKEEVRSALVDGHYKLVVAYDQNTEDLRLAEKDSNLYVVMQSLKQQVEGARVVYLAGGFAGFQSSFPDLTVSPPSHTLSVGQLSLALPTVNSANKDPVEILPFLYLGDAVHASKREMLHRLSFTDILNVSTSCDNSFDSDFRYMKIAVQDNSTTDLLTWFPKAIAFIDNVRKNGGKVLVHCHAGISRSATICLAYLMSKRNLSLENAFDYIRLRRNVINPNLNFMRQLKDFEDQLSGGRVRRGSVTNHECSPLTPGAGECGIAWHGFSFPVPTNCTPLVSPS